MSQPESATQRSTTAGTLPPTFLSIGRAPETLQSGFALTCGSETLRWTDLTYQDRTFVFNRELVIRVTQEEGGCSFNSDDPELFGFGHTRAEAELVFCLDFASCWDDLACEDDEKLTQDAIELKRALLALVKLQR
jgi:hypothetical protein